MIRIHYDYYDPLLPYFAFYCQIYSAYMIANTYGSLLQSRIPSSPLKRHAFGIFVWLSLCFPIFLPQTLPLGLAVMVGVLVLDSFGGIDFLITPNRYSISPFSEDRTDREKLAFSIARPSKRHKPQTSKKTRKTKS